MKVALDSATVVPVTETALPLEIVAGVNDSRNRLKKPCVVTLRSSMLVLDTATLLLLIAANVVDSSRLKVQSL